MRFGLTAFSTARSLAPGDVARAAEDAGFELLLFPDHTHIPVAQRSPFPGGGDVPDHYRCTYDPLIACAFAATATTSLRIGIGVCLVPARDPIVLAKQVASLDVLSGGRFVLGVGVGWNAEEVADHGVAAGERWTVMHERVLAMKAIWRDDEAQFHGQHVDFGPMWSWPKPVQRPHPPILVGGHGDGVLERVIELGDEWLAMVVPGRASLPQRIERLRRMADERERTWPRVSVQVYGAPPPERVIEKMIRAGVDRIDLSLPDGTPEEMLASIGRLGQVIDRFATGAADAVNTS